MNILKTLAASLLVVLTLGACTTTEDLIESKRAAVVAIMAEKTAGNQTGGGLGTGFFIADNIIVTNNHVIDNATKIEVALEPSGKTYEAEVVHKDSFSDVAVIRLKDWDTFASENQYTTLRFAPGYDDVDTVYAIGHPWGLFWTISKGIVSNSLVHKGPGPLFFIQTDADIYNGNSGGPLLNENGEVIGINSMMVANEGGSYGFTIPLSMVEKILADFQKYNEVRWPVIGVVLDGNTIKEVVKGSAAEKAGLKTNDKIVSVWSEDRQTTTPVNTSTDAIYAVTLNDYQAPIKVVIEREDVVFPVIVKPDFKKSSEFPAR